MRSCPGAPPTESAGGLLRGLRCAARPRQRGAGLLLLLSLLAASAAAQPLPDPSAKLGVTAGAVALRVDGGRYDGGQEHFVVTDESTQLFWDIAGQSKKITVQTSLAAPRFRLTVAPVACTAGTPAAETVLGALPTDFLLDTGQTAGSCLLRYRGEALAEQGSGADLHTVTFTITHQ